MSGLRARTAGRSTRDIVDEVCRDFDLKRLPFTDEPAGQADVSSQPIAGLRATPASAAPVAVPDPERPREDRRIFADVGRRLRLDLRAVVTRVSLGTESIE